MNIATFTKANTEIKINFTGTKVVAIIKGERFKAAPRKLGTHGWGYNIKSSRAACLLGLSAPEVNLCHESAENASAKLADAYPEEIDF